MARLTPKQRAHQVAERLGYTLENNGRDGFAFEVEAIVPDGKITDDHAYALVFRDENPDWVWRSIAHQLPKQVLVDDPFDGEGPAGSAHMTTGWVLE